MMLSGDSQNRDKSWEINRANSSSLSEAKSFQQKSSPTVQTHLPLGRSRHPGGGGNVQNPTQRNSRNLRQIQPEWSHLALLHGAQPALDHCTLSSGPLGIQENGGAVLGESIIPIVINTGSKNRRWPKLRGTEGSSEPGGFYFLKGIEKPVGSESKDKFFSLSCFPAHTCTLSRFSCVWLFATLRTIGSFVHGILQARILEWVAMPSSRGSSSFRNLTPVSCVSCIASRFLTQWTTWEAPCFPVFKQKT